MLSYLNLNHIKTNKPLFKKLDIMFPIHNNTTSNTTSTEILKLKEQVKILTEMLICCQKELEDVKEIIKTKKTLKCKESTCPIYCTFFIPMTSAALWFYFKYYNKS